VVHTIGPEKASGLPFFHAFTWCDTVSAFHGKRKKSARQTWNVCKEILITFTKLSQCVTALDNADLQSLEKFVVVMYDRCSADASVNDARPNLFARKQRPYDAIPPTQSALKLHSKRAAYQGGIIWGQATLPLPVTESPADWGWSRQGNTWKIHWIDVPSVAASCQELTTCSCRKGLLGEVQMSSLWDELYSFDQGCLKNSVLEITQRRIWWGYWITVLNLG